MEVRGLGRLSNFTLPGSSKEGPEEALAVELPHPKCRKGADWTQHTGSASYAFLSMRLQMGISRSWNLLRRPSWPQTHLDLPASAFLI